MDEAIGLVGVALFILGVLALASAVTFATVKLLPPPDARKRQADAEADGS